MHFTRLYPDRTPINFKAIFCDAKFLKCLAPRAELPDARDLKALDGQTILSAFTAAINIFPQPSNLARGTPPPSNGGADQEHQAR